MSLEVEFFVHPKDNLFLRNQLYKEPFVLPSVVEGDSMFLSIGIVYDNISAGQGYLSEQTLSGWSAKVAIGDQGGTPVTSATLSIDSSGKRLEGTLPLNTTAVAALFASEDIVTKTFELEITDGTSTQSFQRSIVLYEEVISSTLVAVAAPDTALGRAEAANLYLKKGENDPGVGFILVSPDGTQKAYVYLTNQGTLEADPLT